MRDKPAVSGDHPSLCMNCVQGRGVIMLSGYCLTGCKCDGCGQITDLAMCARRVARNARCVSGA